VEGYAGLESGGFEVVGKEEDGPYSEESWESLVYGFWGRGQRKSMRKKNPSGYGAYEMEE
jgi:hypothetical protein